MPSGIKIGEQVYLPVARVDHAEDGYSALRRYTVVAIQRRSLRVVLKNGMTSAWIATSAAHKVAGVYVIRVGDAATEEVLLDPLYKSVLQYCRLLLPDDSVRGVAVRSMAELQLLWGKDHSVYGHIVLIGHGRDDAIQFATDGWIDGGTLAAAFAGIGSCARVFLSLCCETGKAQFARAFSQVQSRGCLIAPYNATHGAVASQAAQTFLAHHLLAGRTAKVAFNKMQHQVPAGAKFRMWKNGTRA